MARNSEASHQGSPPQGGGGRGWQELGQLGKSFLNQGWSCKYNHHPGVWLVALSHIAYN